MSYADRITNLPFDIKSDAAIKDKVAAKLAHRDANHAAAAIATEADATIAELVAALDSLLGRDLTYIDGYVMSGQIARSEVTAARAALARAKGGA